MRITPVICGSASFSAVCGPTWAVSPSIAWRPQSRRSVLAETLDRAREGVARSQGVGAGEGAVGQQHDLVGAAKSASRSTCAAEGGPMVTTVTRPP